MLLPAAVLMMMLMMMMIMYAFHHSTTDSSGLLVSAVLGSDTSTHDGSTAREGDIVVFMRVLL